MSGILDPGDLVYVSYPKKRFDPTKPSILHDSEWAQQERSQQQVHRRRTDPDGNHYIDITYKVRKLSKLGKRLDLELTTGESFVCDEHGESAPGMLIGKVRGDEAGA